MAFPTTQGVISQQSRVYDMTGLTGADIYNPAKGTDLGLLSDLIMLQFERDVRIYTGIRTGSSPKQASIDGSGCVIEFGLKEYGPAVMKLIAQRIRPNYGSGELTFGYAGAAASSYKLGQLLSLSETMSLLIADQTAYADRPALFIPYAVVRNTENISLTMAEGMMSPCTIEVIGLHSDRLGGPFLFGNPATFPSWSAPTKVGD